MGGELGFDGPEKPDLGGHLGRQVGEGDTGVLAIELECCVGCGQPLFGAVALWWPCEAAAMTRVRRALPALTRSWGSAQRSRTARSAAPMSPVSGVMGSS